MTRVGASECGQRMSFKICALYKRTAQLRDKIRGDIAARILPIQRFNDSTIHAAKAIVVQSVANGAEGFSDIEGKVTRVGASARGQQTSFKSLLILMSSGDIRQVCGNHRRPCNLSSTF